MPSIVHTTVYTGNAANSTVPLSSPAAVGNYLIVFFVSRFLTSDLITDGGDQFIAIGSPSDAAKDILCQGAVSADPTDNFLAPLSAIANSITFTTSGGNVIEPVIIYEVSGTSMVVNGPFDTNTPVLVPSFMGAAMNPPTPALIFSAIGSGVNAGAVVPSIGVSSGWALDLANNIAIKPWALGVAHQIASGPQQATFSISPNDIALCPGLFITESGGGSPCGSGFVQLINGNFQDDEGNVLANGYLTMQLSQDTQVSVSGSPVGQVGAGIRVKVPLDSSGNIQGTPGDSLTPICIWPNDVMAPAGTYYTVRAYSAVGQLVWGPQVVTVTGASPFDCDTWTPRV